ncbi:MAG TPA: pantoate--beta-alanine ligase [Sediminibacterium sp.]|nr:pantoate--beta-alanine ligase [Sediminibacterium sp.]
MLIARTEKEITDFLAGFCGKRVGFVPTMGALHEGHLALIEQSRAQCDITVCSIFINPTQFTNAQDLEKYPVTTQEDIEKLQAAHCDLLFLPSTEVIYPNGFAIKQPYLLGNLENVLEGAFRPGHFQGVAQVVDRLLQIVRPACLLMGEKDWQQTRVINKMLLGHTSYPTPTLVIGPTIREASGLAKSSRNLRIPAERLPNAAALYHSLQQINSRISKSNPKDLIEVAKQQLLAAGFEKVEYIAVVEADTLEEKENFYKGDHLRILGAAWYFGVRLIDNISVTI